MTEEKKKNTSGMKICVSATASDLDAQLDPRFGRCNYFLIIESETMRFEAVPNAALDTMGGAGIQAAQAIADQGVKTVITGNVGPNAFDALSAGGIKVMTAASGSVREIVGKFKIGALPTIESPTIARHPNLGKN